MKTPEFEIYVAAQKAVQFGLHDVADKIAATVKAGVWKGYELPNRELVAHERFVDFVTTPRHADSEPTSTPSAAFAVIRPTRWT